jgi:hypothetical protein
MVVAFPAVRYACCVTFENLTFLSFPRKRESMKLMKKLDSRFRGNECAWEQARFER